MRKKNKGKTATLWAMMGWAALLGLLSCSSNSTTIRIKADKSRPLKEQSMLTPAEQPLNQRVLTISSAPKQTKDELLAGRVNQMLNHYVKAEDFIAEGKLVEAEEEILRASALVESREVWLVLIKIYEQSGNKAKADSCRKLVLSSTPSTSSDTLPVF